jgi:hypothetical protein
MQGAVCGTGELAPVLERQRPQGLSQCILDDELFARAATQVLF